LAVSNEKVKVQLTGDVTEITVTCRHGQPVEFKESKGSPTIPHEQGVVKGEG